MGDCGGPGWLGKIVCFDVGGIDCHDTATIHFLGLELNAQTRILELRLLSPFSNDLLLPT